MAPEVDVCALCALLLSSRASARLGGDRASEWRHVRRYDRCLVARRDGNRNGRETCAARASASHDSSVSGVPRVCACAHVSQRAIARRRPHWRRRGSGSRSGSQRRSTTFSDARSSSCRSSACRRVSSSLCVHMRVACVVRTVLTCARARACVCVAPIVSAAGSQRRRDELCACSQATPHAIAQNNRAYQCGE
jgi:hypothetical protein